MAARALPAADAQGDAPARAGLLLAALILGAAVANMNLAVANVALPTIGRDLEATQTALNLVAVGFTLGLAASVLYLGALADRHGRRMMLIGGLALSIVAAAVAALAPTVEVLTAARIAGGIAAGMAFPTTLAIINQLFHGAAKTRAIALWTGIGVGASAIAPAVAGFLLEHFGWGSAFALTIPVAFVALILSLVCVPRQLGEDANAVDHLGGVLSVVAVGTLTLGLHFAVIPGSIALGAALIVASLIGFAAFFVRQRRAPYPLFDLSIASRRMFWVAGLAGTIVFGSLMGTMFIGQQYVQNVLGYSTLESGASALPTAIAMILIAPVAAWAVGRFGSRITMSVGIAAVAAGIALMLTWREGASYLPVGAAYAVIGLGVGLAGTPASRSIMAAVPARRGGMGSAMTDLQRDLGAAVMQSVLAAFLTVQYARSIDQQLGALPAAERSRVTSSTASLLRSSFGDAQYVAERAPAYATEIVTAARDAFVRGSDTAILVACAMVIVGFLLAWFLFPRRATEVALEAEYAAED